MVLRVFIAGHCFVAWNTKHDYAPVFAPVCFWLLRLPGTRVLAVGIDKFGGSQMNDGAWNLFVGLLYCTRQPRFRT